MKSSGQMQVLLGNCDQHTGAHRNPGTSAKLAVKTWMRPSASSLAATQT